MKKICLIILLAICMLKIVNAQDQHSHFDITKEAYQLLKIGLGHDIPIIKTHLGDFQIESSHWQKEQTTNNGWLEDEEDFTKQTKTVEENNWLYVELVGNGGLISLNYERYFSDNLSFRVGLGTAITVGALIPIMVNYSYKNILEFGIGIVPYANATTGSLVGKIFAHRKSGLLITSVIGFKRRSNGFIYKVSITPFYNPHGSIWGLIGGLSFGIAF